MFKILDLYIIKKFLSTFVFVLALFVIVIMVFDFAERVDDFIDKQAPAKAIIFDYYLNFIPYFINLFSPLFVFIAAIYFTSRMAYDSEIVAILSSGVSFYRMLVPYLIVACILASTSYYLNGWLIPQGNQKMVEFELKYLRNPFQFRQNNIHRQLAPGEFMYMYSYNNKDSTGYRFALEKFENDELVYKLRANRVEWDGEKENWIVKSYTLRHIEGLNERIEKGEEKELNLDMHPDDFGRRISHIQTMTNKELDQFIETEIMRGDTMVNYFIIERKKRDSMPFATFILVIMAASIASKKVRGGMGLHLILGILLAFSYIMLLHFSTTFSINTGYNPTLSVWIPNIVYGVMVIVLLTKAHK